MALEQGSRPMLVVLTCHLELPHGAQHTAPWYGSLMELWDMAGARLGCQCTFRSILKQDSRPS
jgi:hypothetical protein